MFSSSRIPGDQQSAWAVMLALAGVLSLIACASIGPRTMVRDRSEYGKSVGDSWKCQTLLNIVKLRYLDQPIFVDVGQIVAGYTIERSGSVGGTLESGPDSFGFGAAGRYTDRPTITYTPLTGNKFVHSLMMPLPPESVFYMIQAGWAADRTLDLSLASLNGLKNRTSSIAGVSAPDPDFLRALALMRKIQLSGAVAIRVQRDKQEQLSTLLTFGSTSASPESLADIAELRSLLRLDPAATEFRLAFGATATNNLELAVVTRSLLQIMGVMAANAELPPEDVEQGRATPGTTEGPLKILCTKDKPADAFVAVYYRDKWFWIDDRDLKSKQAFAFVMLLFTLADTEDKGALPMLSISTQ